jgi:hypothetical protein
LAREERRLQALAIVTVYLGVSKHLKHCKSIAELKHAKLPVLEPSPIQSRDLLQLNRNQLKCVTGLLMGHCNLKGHYTNWDWLIIIPATGV